MLLLPLTCKLFFMFLSGVLSLPVETAWLQMVDLGSYQEYSNHTYTSYSASLSEPKHKVTSLASQKDFRLKKYKRLMKDTSNMFVFQDTKAVVYHDEKTDTWVQTTFSEPETVVEPQPFQNMVPVSACLYASSDTSASISKGYGTSISATVGLSASLAFSSIPNVGLKFGVGRTAGATFQYSDLVTCTVSDDSYAQIFIQPWYVEIPESETVAVKYDKLYGLVPSKLVKKAKAFKLLSSNKPNHLCKYAKDWRELQCAQSKTSYTFTQDQIY